MNNDYKSFSCYEKMEQELKASFDKIVTAYSGELSGNTVVSMRPSILYDFEHHCNNIYKTISDIIFDEDIVYDTEKGIKQRELYILNLAVLFHSIGIFKTTMDSLCEYPQKSAEYMKKEYNDGKSCFKRQCGLISEEAKALIDIIRVHNDISKKPELTGNLEELINLKQREGKTCKIRTSFLAGVLRLANKMDVTTARLGNDDFESNLKQQLESAGKKEIEKTRRGDDYSEAKEDFEKLHFVSNLGREDNRKTVILVIDDDFVESYIEEYNIESAADKIFDIYSKLRKELYGLKENVFNKSGKDAHFIPIDNVKISTDIQALDKCLKGRVKDFEFNLFDKMGAVVDSKFDKKALETISSNEEKNTDKDPSTSSTLGKDQRNNNDKAVSDFPEDKVVVSAIYEEIEKEMSNEIQKRNLLKFGHFRLDNKYCARDWIDTRELVETEKISSKMVHYILKHMKENSVDCDMIVGIDLVGALLASRLAFSLMKPLTYIIPKKIEKYDEPHEREYDLKGSNNIIIVIDSIVTGETVQQIIDENNLENRIMGIYAMFYRKDDDSEFESILRKEYLEKVYCLNTKQPAEVFLKSKCKYNAIKCMDRNSRVY